MTEEESLKKWAEAKTLEDIGELTALWLEGNLPYAPSNGASPDEETSEIQDHLIFFNRHGFITTFSQPAEELDSEGSTQRACVGGIASEKMAKKLSTLTVFSELLIFVQPVGWQYGYQVPISLWEFKPYTWSGSGIDLDYQLQELGAANDELTEVISNSWQVCIIDLQWGRKNLLWEVVTNVLKDDYDNRYSSAPYDEGLETDFVF